MHQLPAACFLCGKTLKYNSANNRARKQGLPLTDDTHDLAAKSEAHYGQVGGNRSRQQFAGISDAAWQEIDVGDRRGSRLLCYECHEVVLRNPVFSESQLERLAGLSQNKAFEQRVVVLNRIIEAGPKEFERRASEDK